MDKSWTAIEAARADASILLIADHASNHVPARCDLGIDARYLSEHVALDIGVAELGAALCDRLGCAAIFGAVSRLVIDLNRELDTPGLIPLASDGLAIPGNQSLDPVARAARIDRLWTPYHDEIARRIAATRPTMLFSLHSFTPQLAERPHEQRLWQIGVLYNDDERAARIAIPLLEAAGVVTGDNLPYSGKVLNATMNRHGEANGIAYLGLEVRQDMIGDPAGVTEWADRLAPIVAATAAGLAR